MDAVLASAAMRSTLALPGDEAARAIEREAVMRAASYLRMSTEHQNYSLANQADAIAAHAAARGYVLVRTYADQGISGLSLRGRAGLKRLLADVVGGRADYGVVLVYDVSRWGRFQDPDQSAHYEFLCREAGVGVEYVAEPFVNDGALASTLVKHLKRAMAAEFSRELSTRVSAGKRRLAAAGYWVGGPPGYGLRRQALSAEGVPGPVLASGQHKAIHTDRVVLVAGPPEEVATVRRIFRLFVAGGLSRAEISRTLNREGVPAAEGQPWTPHRVAEVLTNEKYLGVAVFGRSVGRLGTPVRRQPPDSWVRAAGAFPPIVEAAWFEMARRQVRARHLRLSDERLLSDLRDLLARAGRLTAGVIDDAEGVACACVYRRRFGGLIQAYERIGYSPSAKQRRLAEVCHRTRPDLRRRFARPRLDEELVEDLRRLLAREGRLSVQLINAAPDLDQAETYRRRFGGMRRAYSLAGYRPTEAQEAAMDSHGGQCMSRPDAPGV
ncbi:recombinase family protein [Phenylobacterium sp.]|uniref:recombinase family protein n=1 Tax=Phenylobacterium sp. TaxID=1871053 RepID=UPI002FE14BFA